MPTYVLTLEETTYHEVQVDAPNKDEAERIALKEWREGDLVDPVPKLANLECTDIRERYEYEDDGQPDEAQEWHDFDPDC